MSVSGRRALVGCWKDNVNLSKLPISARNRGLPDDLKKDKAATDYVTCYRIDGAGGLNLVMRRDALAEIARDPSIVARSRLLQSLSDLVFDSRLPSAQEVVELCGIATLLLKVADDDSRRHFATTIAPSRHVPREMVFLLLQDKVAIAGPVLRDSPVLTDEDIEQFVSSLPDERLAFIAMRQNLVPGMVEVLVERGGEVVQLAISENDSAPLTAKSLKILIHNAERSESLCRSLVRRPEVSKSDAEHLVQLITRILKSRMRVPEPVAATPMPELNKLPGRVDIRELTGAVLAGRMSADIAVTRLANEDRSNELTSLISALSRIDDVSIMRLLVRADANGIGMILKALDISDAGFAAVAVFRQRRLRHSDTQVRFERDDYAKLIHADCKATLTQLAGQRRTH